jgi:hypothetical protein
MATVGNDTHEPRRSVRARAFTLAFAAAGLCLAAARALGATVSLEVSPAAAELGEAVTLKVSVSGSRGGGTPRVTLPKGVRIAAGPSQSSMTQIINGRMSSSVDYTYTLQIDSAGAFVIGPATVRVGRRDVRSGAARLVVKAVGSRKDVRIFASIDPARAYAGQLVVATFEFAVARGRKINGYSLTIPFLSGIGDAKVFDPENLLEQVRKGNRSGLQILQVGEPRVQAVAKVSTRDIDGVPYEVYTVRRMVLPSTPGLHDIRRASIVAAVVTGQRRVRGFFGYENRPVTKRIALTSDPLSLEVLAPPTEGRPPGYSGAIGIYELTAEASPTEVALGGEPVALTLTVRGEGNIETVPQPKLADDSGWRLGSVEQQQTTGFEGGRPVGEKRFTIPLRPRSSQVKEIPAAELAVFDPRTESYVTLRTGPIPVRVTVPKDSGALEGVALPEAARARLREREEVKQDIEDIETLVDAGASDAAWLHGGRGLVAFFALPLAAFAAASVVARRRRELKENTALARRLSAAKAARAAFAGLHGDGGAEGEEGVASLPGPGFAEAVAKALQGYLADRLDRPGGEIPPDEAERLLTESGVDQELAGDAAGVLREAGAARFGGGGVEPAELLRRAQACVEAIEKGGAS